MITKMIFALFLFLYCMYSSAIDLNGDGVDDEYRVLRDSSSVENYDTSVIEVRNGSTGKVSRGTFDLGNGGVSQGYYPTDFFVHLNFDVRNTEQMVYGFRWVEDVQDWVLYKISKWNEPYRAEVYSLDGEKVPEKELLPREFSVQRVECCIIFSDFNSSSGDLAYKDRAESNKEVLGEFERVNTLLSSSGSTKQTFFYGPAGDFKIPSPDLMYEFSGLLDSSSVRGLNDYAYYLESNGASLSAAILLAAIHDEYPQRVVAILNLADAYWDIGMKRSACDLYSEYIVKMMGVKKGSIIPGRARQRARCVG